MPDPEVPSLSPEFVQLVHGETYSWCACGRSASQPFCDGSHEGSGFEPLTFVHGGPTNEYSICLCKHTKRPPICDGAHRELMAAKDAADDGAGAAGAMERRFPAGDAVKDEHTTTVSLAKAVPDLPVKDAPASIRYYAEVLGFQKLWDDDLIGFDHTMFACVARGDLELTLDEHRAEETDQPLHLSCRVDDVDALHAEYVARGAKIVEDPTDRVWQERDFKIEDPDGHKISFHMFLKKPSND